jgi:hypothetical protein
MPRLLGSDLVMKYLFTETYCQGSHSLFMNRLAQKMPSFLWENVIDRYDSVLEGLVNP